MTQFLLNKWRLYFTLLSYPEGTVHHVQRWPNFQARSQKNTSWYPVSRCLHQSESYELLEIIPSFIFYWVFECVQKSVHLKWNKTKCHKKGFSLSLCFSQVFLFLCLFMSKHQTLPATRHKINSSLKMGARHHSQDRTAQPAPRCWRDNKANKQSSLFQGYTWAEEFLGH